MSHTFWLVPSIKLLLNYSTYAIIEQIPSGYLVVGKQLPNDAQMLGARQHSRKVSRMATAHIIQVPVELIDIIDLPGMATFKKFAHPNSTDKLFRATLELKTPASEQTFKRRVNISDVSTTVNARDWVENVDRALKSEPQIDAYIVRFNCELSGQWFTGEYDYNAHKGLLEAYSYSDTDDYEPEDTWNL